MKRAALLAASLLAITPAALAGVGPGVGVSLIRPAHQGRAIVNVSNPGKGRGTYTIDLLTSDGEVIPAITTPAVVRVSRGRSRKVRIQNITPDTTQLCASVFATSSLRLRSCVRPQQ